MKTNKNTRLPLDLRPEDRDLIEAAARVRELKMTTWTRLAAVERSRQVLDELDGGSPYHGGGPK